MLLLKGGEGILFKRGDFRVHGLVTRVTRRGVSNIKRPRVSHFYPRN